MKGNMTAFILFLLSFIHVTAFTLHHRIHHRLTPLTLKARTTDDDGSCGSIGFLGCGTIATAIARGLLRADMVDHIAVTRRSESKSQALQNEFGVDIVSIHDNPQDILDQANIIFLCVLPRQANDMLQSLRFDPNRHVLVSLVATTSVDDLKKYSGLENNGDASTNSITSSDAPVYKMICLPAVASNDGVCIVTPSVAEKHAMVLDLMQALGGYVQASSEEQMNAMIVPAGLMGSFYGILRNNRNWLVQNVGMDRSEATDLVTRYYYGMLQDAMKRLHENDAATDLMDELIHEQTPGGLNEQALRNLESLGAIKAYDQVQDALYSRIRGISDGSL